MQMRLIPLVSVLALGAAPAVAQLPELPSNSRYGNGQFMPLAPVPPTGQPIAPFFEGWYANPDGTYTLSFGFFNLNGQQTLDVPIGPNNFIEPADFNGKQPTHFPGQVRRDRGVFEITVPASWRESQERVVWTLTANGVTNSVPARVGYSPLQLGHEPMAMGSLPPELRFEQGGAVGSGLPGLWAPARTAKVGEPMMITLWADEVSVRAPDDVVNTDVFVSVSWFKYQGPADEVDFQPQRIKVDVDGGRATTNVTFTAPGEYVLRARLDNWNANDSTGGDQCCWTNGYVRVTVTN
jgi:hypothetical protein